MQFEEISHGNRGYEDNFPVLYSNALGEESIYLVFKEFFHAINKKMFYVM